MPETAVQRRTEGRNRVLFPFAYPTSSSIFLSLLFVFRYANYEDSARCTNEGLSVCSRVAWLPRQTAQFQCSHKLKNLRVCYQAACATYTVAGSEQPLCAGWMIRSVKYVARMNSRRGGEVSHVRSPSETSLKGDYEKQSDQRAPRKRARKIGWSRWYACQPADEVRTEVAATAATCTYVHDGPWGDVARGRTRDTVFPPWGTNRILCNASFSNEIGSYGGWWRRNGRLEEGKRHGASRNSTGGSEPSSNRGTHAGV
ncbi:hypothetical protein WN51_13904 [Melipona quadrifasciata]|uniref:Uncharacterized protein n=1 Tax=Melipona quadrifasciata TaxID=166423 RepID=A0A0M9A0G3_9HYME|nr:hypothetical protein WN51_13904 [Melipona quadrifasciata]